MSLSWPEDSSPATGERHEGPNPLRDPQLSAFLGFPPPSPPGDGERHLARRLTILAVIVVLVAIGAVVFLHGLPTVFPTMNCNGCFNARP